MTHEPSREAVEAAYDHYHTGLEVGRERMATALTAAVPIELAQERKRWEEEVRGKLRRRDPENPNSAVNALQAANCIVHGSPYDRLSITDEAFEAALNTIFGPEEEGTRVDEAGDGSTSEPDSCPTCGSPVKAVTSDEGTSHYVPVRGGADG